MTKHLRISLDDIDHRALLELQARYHFATAHEALRFALRVCTLSPSPHLHTRPGQGSEERQRAQGEVQQFAEQVVDDAQSPLFVVRAALELLSSRLPSDGDAKTKKLLAAGMTGVQQLQVAMDKLRAAVRGGTQEQPAKLRGKATHQQSQRRAAPPPGARSRNTRAALAVRRATSSRKSRRRKL
jgi:light-regulated signal transduction histidine kinase (bacteriophytochrome)